MRDTVQFMIDLESAYINSAGSIHRIVGRCDGGREKIMDNDRAAFALIAPFAGSETLLREAA